MSPQHGEGFGLQFSLGQGQLFADLVQQDLAEAGQIGLAFH